MDRDAWWTAFLWGAVAGAALAVALVISAALSAR